MAGLFDDLPAPPTAGPYRPVTLNVTVPAAAVKRLTPQCRAIIDRLRRGRATNAELCAIGLKYNARISELRQAGYDLRCVEHDHETGVARYALFEGGREVTAER
jgi:hypothetical protein